jgi:hypothetical protein
MKRSALPWCGADRAWFWSDGSEECGRFGRSVWRRRRSRCRSGSCGLRCRDLESIVGRGGGKPSRFAGVRQAGPQRKRAESGRRWRREGIPTQCCGAGRGDLRDPVADSADFADLFHVEMDQFSRRLALVASRRLLRFEGWESMQIVPAQPTGDCGAGQLEHEGNLGSRAALTVQSLDCLDLNIRQLSSKKARSARPVGQAAESLRNRRAIGGLSLAQTDRLSGLADRYSPRHPLDQQLSTCRSASGILVEVHPCLLGKLRFRHHQLPRKGSGGQPLSMNNVVRLHI